MIPSNDGESSYDREVAIYEVKPWITTAKNIRN
jgi:hypothetical protein